MIKPLLLYLMTWLAAGLCHADQLVLLTWDDYISQDVLQAFEYETGHEVKVAAYDGNDQRDSILTSRAIDQFDLVVIDNVAAQIFGKSNRLSAIEGDADGLWSFIDSRWQESCGNFGVPYHWGTVGIAYREDKLDHVPNSWQHLLDPPESLKGHVGMHLDRVDTLLPALKTLGISMNTSSQDDLKKAYQILEQQRPDVLAYQYPITYQTLAVDKNQLYLTLAYSGDQTSLNKTVEGEPWAFVIPQEGTGIWVDCMSIVESSSKKQIAKAFIRFINRPEMAAMNSNYVWVASPNKVATPFLDSGLLADEAVYPRQSILDKSESYRILSDNNTHQRLRIIRALRQ